MVTNDQNDLTEEQWQCMQHFSEIVDLQNFDSAIDLLRQHSWNLESAIISYMELEQNRQNGNQLRHRHSRNEHNLPNIDLVPHNQTVVTSNGILQNYHGSWLVWGLKLLLSPFQLALSVVSSAFNMMYNLYASPRSFVRTDPVKDVKDYISYFNSKFDTCDSKPIFFDGSYAQAVKEAKKSLRFLVIYLHSRSQSESEEFVRNSLCNKDVCEYLNDLSEFIFWSCDVESHEGSRVAHSLRARPPFIGLVSLSNRQDQDSSSNKMALLLRIHGKSSPENIINQLNSISKDTSSSIYVARLERMEMVANQELRREQDEAYLQSLAIDRAKREIREEMDRAAKFAVDAQEEASKLLDTINKANSARSEFWSNNLPDEPQAPENTVKLSIKMPNGRRFTRSFCLDHSTKLLYCTILAQDDCPHSFELVSNFPKRAIDCKPTDDKPLLSYLDLNSTQSLGKSCQDTWIPDASNEYPPSFKEAGLIRPEIILVLNEDA